jgi:hypothetical protein
MRRTSLLVLGLITAAPLAAQQPVEGESRVHTVRPGDTLWDLARLYLANPYLWPEIHRLNSDVVRNPHWIYPNETLRIPGGARTVAEAAFAGFRDDVAEERTVFFAGPTGQAEVPGHTVREVRAVDAPARTPGVFDGAGRLVPAAQMRPAARVRGKESASVGGARMAPQIQLRDRIYLTPQPRGTLAVGQRLHLMRAEHRVGRLGQVFVPTGMVTITSLDGGVAMGVVDQMYDRIQPGDLAMPLAEFPLGSGERAVRAGGAQGSVVALQNPHPLVATQEIVFIDAGQRQGVGVGDEFEVYIPARRTRDGAEPEIVVGELQVVRVEDATAAARVVALHQPALETGLRIRQIRRMP